MQGRTVSVKMKPVTFEVLTRAQSLSFYTNDAEQISRVACQIIRNEIDAWQQTKGQQLQLRLLG